MRLRDAVTIEDRGHSSPCWIWQRGRNPKGYGVQRVGRKICKAHRLAYGAFRAPIPEGLTIDHLCRVRDCVNPVHLEPVTFGENTRRGMSPAHIARRSGRCREGHALSYRRTSGVAYCNPCQRIRRCRKAVA